MPVVPPIMRHEVGDFVLAVSLDWDTKCGSEQPIELGEGRLHGRSACKRIYMEADQGVVLGESHQLASNHRPSPVPGIDDQLVHIEDHRSRRIDKRAAIAKAATDVGAE